MPTEYALEFAFDGVDYKLPTLMLAEARAIQRVTGFTVQEFFEALEKSDAEAITALVWIARKRYGEANLRFDDVDGDLATFDVIGPEDEEVADEGKGEPSAPTDAGPSNGEVSRLNGSTTPQTSGASSALASSATTT